MALRLVDGFYEEMLDDSIQVSRALTAGGGPLFPPDDWFDDPQLKRPTPITVTADGRIYGHIAPWNVSHIGMPPGTKPPKSQSGYAYFRTGVLQTDKGRDVPVGQLTLAGGHAPLSAGAGDAVQHYDDTASAVADLTCGEDAHGIWVSGGLRPGVTDEQIRALRASAPSGDWRPIDGSLELVAVCQVNTPGFPLARAMVASGELTALVAAGAADMYELQQESAVLRALQSVAERVAALESDVEAITAAAPLVRVEESPKKKMRLVTVEPGEERDDTEYLTGEDLAQYLFDESDGEVDVIEFDESDPEWQQLLLEKEELDAEEAALVSAAQAAGPDRPRVLYNNSKNVLVILDPTDNVNTSYDSREMADTDNGGLGIDTQSNKMSRANLAEQGYMPDVASGNVGMKREDQGPNGSRMDGDGDFDGDRDPKLPKVHSTKSGFGESDHDEFNHTIDKCMSGCTNPAHSSKSDSDKGGITAAATKGKKSSGAVDDPQDGDGMSVDGNDDSSPRDAESGTDVQNDSGSDSKDVKSARLRDARKRHMKLAMGKYKSRVKSEKVS